MASHTELHFADTARAALLAGTGALADAVRPTLGPQSRAVIIERKWGDPIVCDDGVTIAKTIRMRDPAENLGAQLLKQAAMRTGDAVGDGTTTSTLLAHAMLAEGIRNIVVGARAVEIRHGLQRGLSAAVSALAELSRPVAGREDMTHIASVSAHGDEQIGAMVADAVERVGQEGVIEVEEASGIDTTLDVVEGMQFDSGYLSPYFVTDPERMEAVLADPAILLTDRRISAVGDLLPLLEQVVNAGRPLLVIAESLEGEALATLVVNRLRGSLATAAVKAPGFGQRRRANLDDVAILTGGQVISDELGIKLENVTLAELGRAERVVIDKDTTTIVGGGGQAAAIQARCTELRREIENTESDWDREKLHERLARLASGVAVIRVGASTEAELKRRKEAYDDAISATKAAVAEGIVPGGGTALLRVDAAVREQLEHCRTDDERTGVRILARALEVPARQIAINAGADDGVVIQKVQAGTAFDGFDARTCGFVDLDAAGIIDPTKVVRVALENATSVAGVMLLAEATLVEIEDASEPVTPHAEFA